MLIKIIFVLLSWIVLSSSIFYSLIQHHYFPLLQTCYLSAGSSALLIGIAYLFFQNKTPNLYGNARFANRNDIQKTGLFSKKGILLGKAFSKDLMLDGYEHVILFAPTGTGKTTSITIPNLLQWQESCIVNDIKLELFKRTSEHRKSLGQSVFLWNPAAIDGYTSCYNPLDVISSNHQTRIDDIQKIATIFIPNPEHSDPIWAIQSRMLFIALILYVLDTDDIPKNIHEVIKLVKNTPDFHQFILDVLQNRDDLDPICKQNFMKFAELHEKTRLSIIATFQSYFELFDNPLIAYATSKSDFDIRKLRSEKMTVYVGVTNDNLIRLSPLLTIFYQQVIDVMTRQLPTEQEPHGVLLLMDEFAALKKMESFQKNIGVFREYKLRVLIAVQELSQLYNIYGRDGSKVFINAKVRIAFTQNDEETCQLISSMLGNKTVAVKQKSQGKQGQSISTHYVAKPLMFPQEILLLSRNKALIFVEGHLPILANKLNKYLSRRF